MLISIFNMVFLPVTAGIIRNHYFHSFIQRIEMTLPSLSMIAILLIIGIVVALNQHALHNTGPITVLAVILHNSIGLVGGYFIARFFQLNLKQSRTVALEVGMQNSGLGIGTILMKYIVQRCDQEGAKAYLESTNPGNISFYKRLGFDVVGEVQLGSVPLFTPMIRLPV